MTSINPI